MKPANPERTKTYRGSCHCGAIRFEADIDLSAGTGRCNCTFCTKSAWWGSLVRPSAFRLQSGEELLSDYSRSEYGHHRFCSRCGIRPFGDCNIPEIGGRFVSINLNCLDDVDLEGVPVTFRDGRSNTWQDLGTERYLNPFRRPHHLEDPIAGGSLAGNDSIDDSATRSRPPSGSRVPPGAIDQSP